MRSFNRTLKCVSLVTVLCFVVTQISWSAPADGMSVTRALTNPELPFSGQVQIPENLGTISDYFLGERGTGNGERTQIGKRGMEDAERSVSRSPLAVPRHERSIVLIQNAHANYDGQQKVRELLRYLDTTYGFKTVFVEGAAEKLDPSQLNYFSDAARNKQLAEYLAKQGILSGAGLYLSERPKGVEGLGIEDVKLYRANYEALKTVFSASAQVDRLITKMETRLATLFSKMASPELRRSVEDRQRFERGHRDLLPFVNRLRDQAKTVLGLDMKNAFSQLEWPQLVRLIAIQEVETKLDIKKAAEERTRLVRFLKSKQVAKETILLVESAFGDTPADAGTDYRAIFDALLRDARTKGLQLKDWPAFTAFAAHRTLKQELDAPALFKEIEKLFSRITDALVKTPEEKELLQSYRDLALFSKLLRLELSREDYSELLKRKISAETMIHEITGAQRATVHAQQNIKGQNIERHALSVAPVFNAAMHFYEFADQREQSFYEKIDRQMRERHIEKAVVVTGGFHTEGLSTLLKEHGADYAVVTPHIAEGSDSRLYKEAMIGTSGSVISSRVAGEAISPQGAVATFLDAAQPQQPEFVIIAQRGASYRVVIAAGISAVSGVNDPAAVARMMKGRQITAGERGTGNDERKKTTVVRGKSAGVKSAFRNQKTMASPLIGVGTKLLLAGVVGMFAASVSADVTGTQSSEIFNSLAEKQLNLKILSFLGWSVVSVAGVVAATFVVVCARILLHRLFDPVFKLIVKKQRSLSWYQAELLFTDAGEAIRTQGDFDVVDVGSESREEQGTRVYKDWQSSDYDVYLYPNGSQGNQPSHTVMDPARFTIVPKASPRSESRSRTAESLDAHAPLLHVEKFKDGGIYNISHLEFSKPNLFTEMAFLGNVFVKIPSDKGVSDFLKYIKLEISDPMDVRRNEPLEEFGNLDQALEQFPEFKNIRDQLDPDTAHWLVVYALQYRRLQRSNLVSLPKTRFIVLERPFLFFWKQYTPAIVQETIDGLPLWDMVDTQEGVFLPTWERSKGTFREQLAPLMNSDMRNHIDWNIKNFVWNYASRRFYYVDLKPSTLASKFSFEHNLASLRQLLEQPEDGNVRAEFREQASAKTPGSSDDSQRIYRGFTYEQLRLYQRIFDLLSETDPGLIHTSDGHGFFSVDVYKENSEADPSQVRVQFVLKQKKGLTLDLTKVKVALIEISMGQVMVEGTLDASGKFVYEGPEIPGRYVFRARLTGKGPLTEVLTAEARAARIAEAVEALQVPNRPTFPQRSTWAAAFETFAELKAVEVFDQLISMVEDEDLEEDLKIMAIATLGRIGDERAIQVFTQASWTASEEVLNAIVSALEDMASDHAISVLRLFLPHQTPSVAKNTVIALGRLGRDGNTKAVHGLVSAFSKGSFQHIPPETRVWIAMALGEIGDPSTVSALKEALDDGDEVAESAQAALAKIEAKNAGKDLPRSESRLTPGKDVEFDRAKAALEPRRGDGWFAKSALNRKIAAVRKLGDLGDTRAVSDLLMTLKSPDKNLRKASADALGQIKDPLAVPDLILALNDPDTEVRYSAADALGKILDPRVAPAIIDVLDRDGYTPTIPGICALGKQNDPLAGRVLRRFLKNGDTYEKQSAAIALGELKFAEAIPDLIEALNDPEYLVSEAAASALAKFDDPRVAPALQAYNERIEREARERAAEQENIAQESEGMQADQPGDPMMRSFVLLPLLHLAGGQAGVATLVGQGRSFWDVPFAGVAVGLLGVMAFLLIILAKLLFSNSKVASPQSEASIMDLVVARFPGISDWVAEAIAMKAKVLSKADRELFFLMLQRFRDSDLKRIEWYEVSVPSLLSRIRALTAAGKKYGITFVAAEPEISHVRVTKTAERVGRREPVIDRKAVAQRLEIVELGAGDVRAESRLLEASSAVTNGFFNFAFEGVHHTSFFPAFWAVVAGAAATAVLVFVVMAISCNPSKKDDDDIARAFFKTLLFGLILFPRLFFVTFADRFFPTPEFKEWQTQVAQAKAGLGTPAAVAGATLDLFQNGEFSGSKISKASFLNAQFLKGPLDQLKTGAVRSWRQGHGAGILFFDNGSVGLVGDLKSEKIMVLAADGVRLDQKNEVALDAAAAKGQYISKESLSVLASGDQTGAADRLRQWSSAQDKAEGAIREVSTIVPASKPSAPQEQPTQRTEARLNLDDSSSSRASLEARPEMRLLMAAVVALITMSAFAEATFVGTRYTSILWPLLIAIPIGFVAGVRLTGFLNLNGPITALLVCTGLSFYLVSNWFFPTQELKQWSAQEAKAVQGKSGLATPAALIGEVLNHFERGDFSKEKISRYPFLNTRVLKVPLDQLRAGGYRSPRLYAIPGIVFLEDGSVGLVGDHSKTEILILDANGARVALKNETQLDVAAENGRFISGVALRAIASEDPSGAAKRLSAWMKEVDVMGTREKALKEVLPSAVQGKRTEARSEMRLLEEAVPLMTNAVSEASSHVVNLVFSGTQYSAVFWPVLISFFAGLIAMVLLLVVVRMFFPLAIPGDFKLSTWFAGAGLFAWFIFGGISELLFSTPEYHLWKTQVVHAKSGLATPAAVVGGMLDLFQSGEFSGDKISKASVLSTKFLKDPLDQLRSGAVRSSRQGQGPGVVFLEDGSVVFVGDRESRNDLALDAHGARMIPRNDASLDKDAGKGRFISKAALQDLAGGDRSGAADRFREWSAAQNEKERTLRNLSELLSPAKKSTQKDSRAESRLIEASSVVTNGFFNFVFEGTHYSEFFGPAFFSVVAGVLATLGLVALLWWWDEKYDLPTEMSQEEYSLKAFFLSLFVCPWLFFGFIADAYFPKPEFTAWKTQVAEAKSVLGTPAAVAGEMLALFQHGEFSGEKVQHTSFLYTKFLKDAADQLKAGGVRSWRQGRGPGIVFLGGGSVGFVGDLNSQEILTVDANGARTLSKNDSSLDLAAARGQFISEEALRQLAKGDRTHAANRLSQWVWAQNNIEKSLRDFSASVPKPKSAVPQGQSKQRAEARLNPDDSSTSRASLEARSEMRLLAEAAPLMTNAVSEVSNNVVSFVFEGTHHTSFLWPALWSVAAGFIAMAVLIGFAVLGSRYKKGLLDFNDFRLSTWAVGIGFFAWFFFGSIADIFFSKPQFTEWKAQVEQAKSGLGTPAALVGEMLKQFQNGEFAGNKISKASLLSTKFLKDPIEQLRSGAVRSLRQGQGPGIVFLEDGSSGLVEGLEGREVLILDANGARIVPKKYALLDQAIAKGQFISEATLKTLAKGDSSDAVISFWLWSRAQDSAEKASRDISKLASEVKPSVPQRKVSQRGEARTTGVESWKPEAWALAANTKSVKEVVAWLDVLSSDIQSGGLTSVRKALRRRWFSLLPFSKLNRFEWLWAESHPEVLGKSVSKRNRSASKSLIPVAVPPRGRGEMRIGAATEMGAIAGGFADMESFYQYLATAGSGALKAIETIAIVNAQEAPVILDMDGKTLLVESVQGLFDPQGVRHDTGYLRHVRGLSFDPASRTFSGQYAQGTSMVAFTLLQVGDLWVVRENANRSEARLTPQEQQFQKAFVDLQPQRWDGWINNYGVARRVAAVKYLGEIKGPLAVILLMRVLYEEERPDVLSAAILRRAVIAALCNRGAFSVVMEALNGRMPNGLSIIKVLGELKEQAALQEFFFDSNNFYLRLEALRELAKLDTRLASVREYLDSQDARQAFGRKSRQPHDEIRYASFSEADVEAIVLALKANKIITVNHETVVLVPSTLNIREDEKERAGSRRRGGEATGKETSITGKPGVFEIKIKLEVSTPATKTTIRPEVSPEVSVVALTPQSVAAVPQPHPAAAEKSQGNGLNIKEAQAAEMLYDHMAFPDKDVPIPATETGWDNSRDVIVVLGNPDLNFAQYIYDALSELHRGGRVLVVGKGKGAVAEWQRLTADLLKLDVGGELGLADVMVVDANDASLHTGMNIATVAGILRGKGSQPWKGAANAPVVFNVMPMHMILIQAPQGLRVAKRIFEYQWSGSKNPQGLGIEKPAFYTYALPQEIQRVHALLRNGDAPETDRVIRFNTASEVSAHKGLLQDMARVAGTLPVYASPEKDVLALKPGDVTDEVVAAQSLINDRLTRAENRNAKDALPIDERYAVATGLDIDLMTLSEAGLSDRTLAAVAHRGVFAPDVTASEILQSALEVRSALTRGSQYASMLKRLVDASAKDPGSLLAPSDAKGGLVVPTSGLPTAMEIARDVFSMIVNTQVRKTYVSEGTSDISVRSLLGAFASIRDLNGDPVLERLEIIPVKKGRLVHAVSDAGSLLAHRLGLDAQDMVVLLEGPHFAAMKGKFAQTVIVSDLQGSDGLVMARDHLVMRAAMMNVRLDNDAWTLLNQKIADALKKRDGFFEVDHDALVGLAQILNQIFAHDRLTATAA